MRHEPLDASELGGFASTGNSLFVHFSTRQTTTTVAGDSYMVAEGWALSWMFSEAGEDCMIDDVDPPPFGNSGSCQWSSIGASMRTGETCVFDCDEGMTRSTETEGVWHAASFGTVPDPLCWDGSLLNAQAMTCLQDHICVRQRHVLRFVALYVSLTLKDYRSTIGTWATRHPSPTYGTRLALFFRTRHPSLDSLRGAKTAPRALGGAPRRCTLRTASMETSCGTRCRSMRGTTTESRRGSAQPPSPGSTCSIPTGPQSWIAVHIVVTIRTTARR